MVNGMHVKKRRLVVRRRRVPVRDPTTAPYRNVATRRAFDMDARCMALTMEGQGQPLLNHNGQPYVFPSRRSRQRWRRRFARDGHFYFFRPNGGRRRQVLTGMDLLHLAFYRLLQPSATAAEMIAYLWNVHGRFQNPPRFYHPSQICRAEQDIGLSRKRCGTSARQALEPRVQQWRQNYWTLPYPFGIANIAAADMIDIDEAVVNQCTAKRGYGKAFVLQRARQVGPFVRDESIRIVLAICGDPVLQYRWAQVERGRSGTNLNDFLSVIDRITLFLNQHQPGRVFTFILDNLNIHHNPLALMLILMRGHRFVFRAPYHPFDGPIEYVFNVIENTLTHLMNQIHSDDDVIRCIWQTLRALGSFYPWFHHCGYR